MFATSNDLSAAVRQSTIDLLNDHLAGAIDLQLQAKHAHWNIKGPNFVGLHELFDRVAAEAAQYADLIAERAAALGGVARGTLLAVAERSKLREYPASVSDWRGHVRAMQDAVSSFGRGVRQAIDVATAANDAATADLFTEISRGSDKMLWMIEAHVQGDSSAA